jgi:dolichol-phosphate mannosyltransferase
MISVVIPTYNERENVGWILKEVDGALAGRPHEIIVVDDNSPDGTAAEAAKVEGVRVIKRIGERGLGSAVVRGFAEAKGDVLAVMDADGSHPPTALAMMAEKIEGGCDLVFPSRHIPGGGIEDWTAFRKLVSKGATLLARGLTKCTDPMSGYFMLKKSVIDGVELNPIGFKIGLEILVKGKHKEYGEIPYVFRNRCAGKSKLSTREYVSYIKHLTRLYVHKIKSLLP